MASPEQEPHRRRASLLQTFRAVLWSFFGVRRGQDHDADMAKLNPVHVILAGVLAAVVLVLALLLIVKWVVSSS